MQSDQDETIHMQLKGELADLLAKCNTWLPKMEKQSSMSNCSKPCMGPFMELSHSGIN